MFEIIHPNFFRDLMFQRPQQLLREFAKQGYKAIIYNMNENRRDIVKQKENFFVYNNVFPMIEKQGKRVLWISYPPLYKEIGKYNEDLVVFDSIDYPDEQLKHWKRGINKLRERADVIFATSQDLLDFNKQYTSKVYLCKNGADFLHFNRAATIFDNIPADMKNIKRPIIGYYGALADWVDWSLIRYIALKKKFSIVLLGPLLIINDIPTKLDNVYYLGRKDYDALPSYLQLFDVCIIPFKTNKLTKACNPVKLYEYLSAGKPVITTDLDECKVRGVNYTKTYEEFFYNIMNLLENNTEENKNSRILFAKENSWGSRVSYIRAIIEPLLEEQFQ